MYQCPVCKEPPWFANSKQIMRDHMKLRHKTSTKSGKCPYRNCFYNYGDIHKYMNHVEKNHSITEQVGLDYEGKKRKPSSDDVPPNKKTCMASVSSNNSSTKNNILENSTTTATNVTPRASNLLDIEEESPFDKELLEFHKQQNEKAAEIVRDLYANSSLSKSVVNKIISIIHEYQKSSIEDLKKLDPQMFLNNPKINTALKFLQHSFSNVNTESRFCKQLTMKEALIRPVSKTVDIKLKPFMKKKKGKKILLPVKTQIQIVPMKLVLKKYLEIPNVFKTILESLRDVDNNYPVSSFVQGEFWRNLKLQHHKLVIPLTFYFDDFEINNPLGPHKRKIGAIYFTISCLPPQFSSKLENWFLAQFHNEVDYRRLGNKKMIGIFREQLLELQKDGIQIIVDNIEQRVFFCVGKILGDNLGMNQLLGFVSSFNSSYYCRTCVANREQAQILLEEDHKLLRNQSNYSEDVSNANLSGKHSRGVKERCVFEPLFYVTDRIVVDPLHDLDEGICRYEIASILNKLIFEEKDISFDVDDLNDGIKLLNVDLASGINIPAKISVNSIKDKFITLTGSEMSFVMEYLEYFNRKIYPPRK